MNKITLTNLTSYQITMLDKMWTIDSLEDFTQWQEGLDEEDFTLSQDLAEAVRSAMEDETMDLTEANKILSKFML